MYMLGFNHTLAGSIIAIITPAPLVPVVAFISHFVLDATPHFGRSKRVYPYTRPFIYLLIADAVLCASSLLFAIWLFPDKWFILAVGAFFSTLPDFLWLIEGRVKGLKNYFKFARWVQWGERPYGWIFDGVYAVAMIYTLWVLASPL
jgi:hypothetical protein